MHHFLKLPDQVVASYLLRFKPRMSGSDLISYNLTRNLFNFYTGLNGFANAPQSFDAKESQEFHDLATQLKERYHADPNRLLEKMNVIIPTNALTPVILATANSAIDDHITTIQHPRSSPQDYIDQLGFHYASIAHINGYPYAQRQFDNKFDNKRAPLSDLVNKVDRETLQSDYVDGLLQ